MTRAIAQFIYHNNKIDNIQICSIDYIDGLIDNYSVEIENDYPYILPQYRAYLWILKRSVDPNPIDFSDVVALHWYVNKSIDKRAGLIRETQRIIYGYNCPHPDNLTFMLNKFNDLLSILEDIKHRGEEALNSYFWYIHNVFQCIHPFEMDNGRVGRLLFNMLRAKCHMGISVWDVERNYYFNAIKEFEKTFVERYAPPGRNYGLDRSQL